MAAYRILERGQPNTDFGADYFVRTPRPQLQADKFVPQHQAIGYNISLEPVEAA
jgi:hypothetical protein